ncbi:Uncharacterised protein [Escherichia coli]|nr:hypothetical protein G852_04969 [Escherichia coli HVH 200 (4-4449924)]OYC70580.1 hypothetical protein RX32_04897 [Escherichia coli]CAK0712478.1 hypothetical protein FGAF637_47000 [Escherichia coli]CAK0733402.1 hypothetical protein FGAF1267_49150 [Escherichia coli]CTS60031.1 Uncharacterised protein [Escherichia coli]
MGGIMFINLHSNKEKIVSFEGCEHDIFYSDRCDAIGFGLLSLCF